MKFSNREQQLLSIFIPKGGQEIPLDKIVKMMERKVDRPPKFFRRSLVSIIRKLKIKLNVYGVDIDLVSPIGRGHKAIYKISKRIISLKM